jgi:hypothetical protein
MGLYVEGIKKSSFAGLAVPIVVFITPKTLLNF